MKADEQRKVLAGIPGGVHFPEKLKEPLTATNVDIFQVNVGKRCNLSCRHCHVEAGPDRTEVMSRETLMECLDIIKGHPIGTVDITGGSPEMNPELPWFIEQLSALGRRTLVRSNLVILLEEGYRHFIELYARNKVEVVGSFPACDDARFERQRGSRTFHRSIEAVKLLNLKGYGHPGTGLLLNLVHNPAGAYLPGAQSAMEQEYRLRLHEEHGVCFNTLFCLTNCPVGRYLEFLIRSDNYKEYMHTLILAFNPSAVANVMCRTTISVGWDGRLYDCDFNQMLGLPVNHGAPDHIKDFNLEELQTRRIVIGNHCFSCTAGAGSSCQGALEN